MPSAPCKLGETVMHICILATLDRMVYGSEFESHPWLSTKMEGGRVCVRECQKQNRYLNKDKCPFNYVEVYTKNNKNFHNLLIEVIKIYESQLSFLKVILVTLQTFSKEQT